MPSHETDRRGFLGDVLRGLAGAALVVPKREADPVRSEVAEASRYPFTTQTVKIGSSEVTIVGVQHTDENLASWKDYLLDQFRDKQSVMLESCYAESIVRGKDGQVRMHGSPYFSHFAVAALSSGKRAFDIDIWKVPDHAESAVMGSGMACKYGGVAVAWYAFGSIVRRALDKGEGQAAAPEEVPKEAAPEKSPDAPSRRQAIAGMTRNLAIPAALLGASFAMAPSSATESIQSQFQSGSEYPSFTLNYINDARTVLMLESVKKILAENPGMSAAIIVGDEHAKGMLHYVSHPDEHRRKVGIYDRMYRPIWGNSCAELKVQDE